MSTTVNTVKNNQKPVKTSPKQSTAVKKGQYGQKGSKAVNDRPKQTIRSNTVKVGQISQKRTKTVNNGPKKTVKNGQKLSKTVKNGQTQ